MTTFIVSNEIELRKKLLEIHDRDVVSFDCKPVLSLIEHISRHVTSRNDGPHNGPNRIPDALGSILHKISCELNCKCSGGDMEVTTMEILKLLRSYDWPAKITIILATFVVEYFQSRHLTDLYNTNHPVARLKQIPDNFVDIFEGMESTFSTFMELSLKVTNLIANFSNLPSKYISNEVEAMALAFNKIPIAVYKITKVVVASASLLTQIHTQTQVSWYTDISFDIIGYQEYIVSIQNVFKEQLQICESYVAKKKQSNLIQKLKLKLNKTAVHSNNQKILQLDLFQSKDSCTPLEFCRDKSKKGVHELKEKTVLLYISDLDITDDEIFILSKFYDESREKHEFMYEIVWLPIVEGMDEVKEDLINKMTWYWLPQLKPGVAKFVKEEWHYSNKSILVALDPRGKVVHPDAFRTLSLWGNAAYPFTQTREIDIGSRKQWSLELLVGNVDHRITKWMKEKKFICLYGGEDKDWLNSFIKAATEIEAHVGIKLEMFYIGHHEGEELDGTDFFLESKTTNYFWKRMELMESESGQGGRTEVIVKEVHKIKEARQSNKGWALISHGAGKGEGKMAFGEGGVIFEAFAGVEKWSNVANIKGFLPALNNYLCHQSPFCNECHRRM